MIVKLHGVIWGRKDDATGNQIFKWSTREIQRVRCALRYSHVASRFDELGKLVVGHVRFVHPEAIYIDAVDGPRVGGSVHAGFGGGWRVHRAHGKFSARNPDHSMWYGRGSQNLIWDGGLERRSYRRRRYRMA